MQSGELYPEQVTGHVCWGTLQPRAGSSVRGVTFTTAKPDRCIKKWAFVHSNGALRGTKGQSINRIFRFLNFYKCLILFVSFYATLTYIYTSAKPPCAPDGPTNNTLVLGAV